MPLYEFQKVDEPEKTDTIFYAMKDVPKVGEIITDEKGVKWKRIFTLPYAGVDTKIDHNSAQDFVEKTGKKKGSVGDLFDASKEASEKRAKERGGVDPVQEKFFKDYKKSRNGVEHLEKKRKTKIDKKDYSISYD